MKCGIFGAGIAGLTLGNKLNHDFEILEKNSECGGLCRSVIENGWTFDIGGFHIIFSRDEDLLNLILSYLGSNVVKTRRNTKIFIKGRYVKYPLENGLADLPKEDKNNCLTHFIETRLKQARGEQEEPKNFKDWIYNNFGKGMAELYMVPYNEKVWRCKAEELSVDWVTGRVPQPPVEDVVKSALGVQTEGYTHQLFFYYPETGGIQALIKSLENVIQDRITKSTEIKKIKKDEGKWLVECADETREYDRLISTIPLMELASCLEDVPEKVTDAISSLRYTSLVVVMLGLDAPHNFDITWLYVPSNSDGRFNRVGFPSNKSEKNTPPGCSSILVETTCRYGDEVWQQNDTELIEETIRDLKKMKIIGDQNIQFSKVVRSQYAYVVFDLNYTENIGIIHDYFQNLGIELCGRFSEFKYLNMDAAMKSAVELATKLNEQEGLD